MAKTSKAAEITPATQAALTAIVQRELGSIPGLRFGAKDVEVIARLLAKHKLRSRISEASLPHSFETTAISSKILGLYAACEAEKLTLQDSLTFFLRNPQRLKLHTATLIKNIEAECAAWQALGATRQQAVSSLLANTSWSVTGQAQKAGLMSRLLLNGDLPAPPGTRPPANSAKAVSIILDNRTYSNLLNYSDEEIYAVALLTKLANCSVHATIQINMNGCVVTLKNEDRAAEINKHLAKISDAKWESVKHLAAGAGFARPAPLPPDRFAAIRAAQQKLHDKKFHL